MTGATRFPYPDDDPTSIRTTVAVLDAMAGGVTTTVEAVHGGRGTLEVRWVSPAGGRAVAEVDAIAGLATTTATALADARAPLGDYIRALDDARATIDQLRSSYDAAQAEYEAAVTSSPGADPDDPARHAARSDAFATRDRVQSGLQAQYDEVLTGLGTAATTAAGALTEIAGRVSPAPESRNPDLVRATVLDTLPFMAPHDGTTVIRAGEQVIVDTGHGDDDVHISRDPGTGEMIVTVNGQVLRFSADEARNLVIRTNGGSDVIDVDPGIQVGVTVLGGWGDDLIAGGAGTDTLDGGAGNDDLIGGRGNDALLGGAGADDISDGLSFVAATGLRLQYGGRTVSAREGGGNERVDAGYGDDDIDTGEGDDTIDAGAGNDAVAAGGGNDEVHGGEGDDWISGGDGDDVLHGDEGNDHIWGDAGDDVIKGGHDDDEIHAGEGDDTVDAGYGADYVDAFTGNDHVLGGGGDDRLYAGEGDDVVDGGWGDDYIDGYAGRDILVGNQGDDVLSGGSGDDLLGGDKGNDVVYTGAGRDQVTDRSGHNAIYHQAEDSLLVNGGDQRVTVEIVAIPSNIRIEGSPEFVARTRADLETLAASPVGQKMLQQIAEEGVAGVPWSEGDTVTIRETGAPGGFASAGADNKVLVQYNPTTHITILQHELAHAYNFMSDTMVGTDGGAQYYLGPDARNVPAGVDADEDGRVSFDEVDRDDDGDIDDHDLDRNGDGKVDDDDGWTDNSERQANGLPVDHDHNPATPDVPASQVVDHPGELTENALRREMGLPEREEY